MDKELARLLEEKSNRVERALEEFLKSDQKQVSNLHDGLLYSLGLDQQDPAIRGKRIRPALCLIACEALGGDAEAAVPFAMAVELMHNFFLVHDDIEDGDGYRRGRPSVWKRYGLAHGINIGDYLFTKVHGALLSADGRGIDCHVQLRLMNLLVETLNDTHIGQAQDLNFRQRRDITVGEYLEMAHNKSGYLGAPILGGAMIAGAPEKTVAALRAFGRHPGPLFQIVDDIIDLTDGKGRDQIGSDIREGKRSFLVAYTAGIASESEREDLFRILDRDRDSTTEGDIERVREIFDAHGAIEAGKICCRRLMEQARSALGDVPDRLRETLVAIFDELLEREK